MAGTFAALRELVPSNRIIRELRVLGHESKIDQDQDQDFKYRELTRPF